MKAHNPHTSALVQKWNEFCENNNCFEDIIYYNDEDFFASNNITIKQTIAAVKQNRYDWDHDWVTLDGYANPMSSDEPRDFMDIEEMEMENWLDNVEF